MTITITKRDVLGLAVVAAGLLCLWIARDSSVTLLFSVQMSTLSFALAIWQSNEISPAEAFFTVFAVSAVFGLCAWGCGALLDANGLAHDSSALELAAGYAWIGSILGWLGSRSEDETRRSERRRRERTSRDD